MIDTKRCWPVTSWSWALGSKGNYLDAVCSCTLRHKNFHLVVLLVLFFATSVNAEEWPMFRQNPHHDGVLANSDTAPIIPRKLWSYAVPEGIMFSSPVVSNGMVYIGSNFSVDCKAPGRVYAFRADTGALVWSVATAGSIGDASPAVIDGKVVIGGGDTIYGLDALTGSVRWKQTYPGFCFQESFITAVPELSLIFMGGVSTVDGSGYVFSLTSAGAGWFNPLKVNKAETSGSSAVFGAPTHILDQGLLTFGSYNGNVYGINDGDATSRWTNNPAAAGVYASTAYDATEGILYMGSFDGVLYALGLNGQVVWSYKTGGRLIASPAIVWTGSGKRIIVASEDGQVYAINSSGALVWAFNANSAIYSSIAISGGNGQQYLYFATGNGNFYVLDVDGNPVADPNIPQFLATGLTWASPAIADRRIYIATASPSRFFILGDNALTPRLLLTSGRFKSADVAAFGDMSGNDHLPGVSLWPSSSQWGEPMLYNGRSVRKAVTGAPRFLMNLVTGSSDLAASFHLVFTYKTNGPAYVYQYDGSAYHLLGSLPGDGAWRVGQIATNPKWYADYQGNPSNGINVLFKVVSTGSVYYLDKIEMTL